MSVKVYKPIKPFLTYEQQIQHLRNDKKLEIPDDQKAIKILSNVSYYSLIGGYKSLFYDPSTRIYKAGTSFNDIVSLYQFDDSLRDLVFKYSRRIEEQIRNKISYAFCEKYTNLQSEYLNPARYQNTRKNRYNINKLINILDFAANKSTEHKYIIYQRRTYGNVPLYAVMRTLTLGQTSAMFSLLMQEKRRNPNRLHRHRRKQREIVRQQRGRVQTVAKKIRLYTITFMHSKEQYFPTRSEGKKTTFLRQARA